MKKLMFTSLIMLSMGIQGTWAQTERETLDFANVSNLNAVAAANNKTEAEAVTYIDRRWDDNAKKVIDMEKVKKPNEYIPVDQGDYSGKNFALTDGHWYVMKGEFKADMLIMPYEGNVFLILCDGAKMTCRVHFPYNWRKTSTLHIYGQKNGTGKLIADASGSKYEAGIGGYGKRLAYETGGNDEGGNVIVYGGDITATGSSNAAGIGSSGDETDIDVGTLKVYGGKITANGGSYAAGIGGGNNSDGTTITIYGGTVTGNGGRYGAGIGGGYGGNGSNITVHGGTVKGYGGVDAAGIGSGEMSYGNGDAGKLTVYGGTVEGHGNEHGAGIGGGQSGSGAEVIVYGGTVEGRGGVDAAGIGSGEMALEDLFKSYSLNGGSLTVHGGTVKGYGGEHGAGIGGGQDANGAKVVINGGHVETDGGIDAAGIGSGEETSIGPNINGGSLTVNGGYVFADGTGWGAGIGGGEDADGATVVINGGTVIAYAGSDAGSKNGCAIGAEDGDGHRGSLFISDKMMVHAGQNPNDANSHSFYNDRVPACFFRPYARVEPCNHQNANAGSFDMTDDETVLECPYCLPSKESEATGIEDIETETSSTHSHSTAWYTLDGKRLEEKPTTHGIYIHNGKKYVIK